jgi:hypothetical protein
VAKRISSLSVVLGGTVAPFTSAFASAGKTLDSFKSKVGGIGSTLMKFTGIGAAIGAIVGGAGFGLLFKSQSEAIDSAAKLSDRLGITTESLAALQHAAGLSGVETDALTGGLEKYLKNVSEAAGGNSQLSAAFNSLGLDAKELIGLPTDQAMGKIGDALNAIANPAQRAAAAQEIFGKSGQALLPFLAEGSDGLGAMREEAEALGLTFSRVDAGKVEEANDSISRVGAVAMGVMRQVVIAASPFITQIAGVFTSLGIKIVAGVKVALPIITNLASGLFAILTNVWTSIWATVGPIIGSITSWITSNWQAIVTAVATRVAAMWSVISGVFSAVWQLVQMVGTAVAAAWTWAMELIGFKSDEAGSVTGKSFQSIGDWLLWLENVVTVGLVTIGFAFANWKSVVELAGVGVMLRIVTIGNQIQYVFTEVAPALLSWFADNWQSIFKTLFDFTAAVFTNMGANVWNFFKAVGSWLAGDGFSFEWTGLTEGFESSVKELPQIMERQTGPLEQALQDQQAGLEQQLGAGLADALAKNQQAGKDAADTLAKAMQPGSGPGQTDIKPPNIPPATFDVDTSEAEDKLKGVGDVAKSTGDQIKDVASIGFGSAEQQSRIASAALPAVAPVPASTASAVQETGRTTSAARQSESNVNGSILALLQQWRTDWTRQPTVEFTEAGA